ncbi:MAG: cobalamin-binding protein, partial [Gallionellaceae bacterium]|nr:cobalamin-binding protein [Gallionellaceae bacterium]
PQRHRDTEKSKRIYRRVSLSLCVSVVAFFVLCCTSILSQAAPLTLTDDSGTQIVFATPPQRIISLAPNLTELAYAAGMGSHMVAVTAYSDYPPQAQQLPQIGDAFRLDWERLLALRPDLILAWGSSFSARDRAAFEKLKLKVWVLEPRHLDDIPKILRLLGRVANTAPAAEKAAQTFERERDSLRQQYAGLPVARVYFQIAEGPLLTINDEHIISDVLRLCGGQNVFGHASLLVSTISDEALVQSKPDVMLALAATPEEQEKIRSSWLGLPLLAARQGRIGFIHPDLIARSTPRILQGGRQVCEHLASLPEKLR